MMDSNLGNISAIKPSFQQHLSKNEDTFIQELQMLNTNRSKISQIKVESHKNFADESEIREFSPLLR